MDFLDITITIYHNGLGTGNVQNFLITDFVYLHIVFVERLVYFYKDIELGEIQVCEGILVLCSFNILLNNELHTVVIQLMPYSTYDIRLRLFLADFVEQSFHVFQFVIHIFEL